MLYRLFLLLSFPFILTSEVFLFTPPSEWKLISPQGDSKYILLTFVAPEHHYPPSLSLAHEPISCTQKQYLNAVKNLLSRSSKNCRMLGNKATPAGKCTLFQTENSTVHGDFFTLVAVFFSESEAYTLSFAAKKEAFSNLYPMFEKSILSAVIAVDAESSLSKENTARLEKLKATYKAKLPLRIESMSKMLEKDPILKKTLSSFENGVVEIVGKEYSVHTYYILKDFISELSKPSLPTEQN